MEEKGATLEELLSVLSSSKQGETLTTGDVTKAILTVGQVVGLIHDIPSVQKIIEDIIDEAKPIIRRLRDIENVEENGE